MARDEPTLAIWIIIAVTAGFLLLQAPPMTTWRMWSWRRRTPQECAVPLEVQVPSLGDTWANKWGYTFTLEGYTPDGKYLLMEKQTGKQRILSVQHWPQFASDMSLKRK